MPQNSETLDLTYPVVSAFLDNHIIQRMAESDGVFGPTETYWSIVHFTNDQISWEMARALLRSLTDRGYCRYAKGLFTEDGETAGSGYGLTEKGLQYYKEMHPQEDVL